MALMIEGYGGGILELIHPPSLAPEPHAFESQFSVPAFAMPGLDSTVLEERCIDGRGAAPPTLDLEDVLPGELAISEVLFASRHGAYQWIEVVNLGTKPIDLAGLSIRTETEGPATIDRSLELRPGDRAVIGSRREGDWTHPTLVPDAYWGTSVTLDLSGERVGVGRGDELLDLTAPFESASVGASWQVDPAWESIEGNDDLRAWCHMPVTDDVDLATPGVPNTPCELMELLEP